jgi:hypothetical protein
VAENGDRFLLRLLYIKSTPPLRLEAALDLFVDKGFAATRAEEVAARAGVSKRTLFLYFPSKAQLLNAVVRENIARSLFEGAGHSGWIVCKTPHMRY